MKINKEKYPVLNWIRKENCSLFSFLNHTDSVIDNRSNTIQILDHIFKDDEYFDVAYVSKPFYEAMIKSYNKLHKIISIREFIFRRYYEDISLNEPLHGVILLPNGKYVIYQILKDADNTELIEFAAILCERGKVLEHELRDILSHELDNITDSIFNIVFSYLMFKEYAEIEVKVFDSNKNVIKDPIKCVLKRKKSDVLIYDSSWFTLLVKSDSFKVGGHFRLQPYGPNRNQKKLIWITDYLKKGYVRLPKKQPVNGKIQQIHR